MGSPSVELRTETPQLGNICRERSDLRRPWTQQVQVTRRKLCGIAFHLSAMRGHEHANKGPTHGGEAHVVSPLLPGHFSPFNSRFLVSFFMFLPHAAAAPTCLLPVGAIVQTGSRSRGRAHARTWGQHLWPPVVTSLQRCTRGGVKGASLKALTGLFCRVAELN